MRCLQGAARARRRGAAGRDARRRSAARRSGSTASPPPPPSYGIPTITPADPNAPEVVARVARTAAGFPVLVLLPRDAEAAAARAAAARRAQHARLAAAEVPRPRAGELGDHPRRNRNRRDAALHDRETRRRRHRGADRGADPARRHREGSVRQGDGRGRDHAGRRAARADRRHRAAHGRRISSRGTYFGGRKPEDGVIDWSRERGGDSQPRARGRAALSWRAHDARRPPGAHSAHARARRSAPRRRRHRLPREAESHRRALRRRRNAAGPRARDRWRRDVRCDCPCAALAARARAKSRTHIAAHMRRILILGVNGFIGHHLSQRIIADDRLGDLRHGHADRSHHRSAGREALPFLRRRHHDQQGVDRVSHQEVRHGAAAGRDRHAGDLRARAAARVRARLRGQPADRPRLRAAQEAHRVSVDLGGLRHVPRRRIRPGDLRAGAGTDQQAALDLRLRQAAHGPRDPRLRHAGGPRLHAVPSVQLDRRGTRLDQHGRRKAARA